MMEEQEDNGAEYDAWVAEQEKLCGRSYSTGGSDPYGTDCELDTGHSGNRHIGRDPFGGDGWFAWTGGGMCAGDPLPMSDTKFMDKRTCVVCGNECDAGAILSDEPCGRCMGPPAPDPMYDTPVGTPYSWMPDNPNEDGFCQSDFV